MPPEPTTYRVDLEPVDPLLFGDNRPARAGFDHLQLDQDPSPLTLHGAIGQHLVDRAGGSWPASWLGPREPDVLEPAAGIASLLGYCLRASGGRRLFPRPLHLRCRRNPRGELEPIDLLAPAAAAGAASSCGQPELLVAVEERADEYEGPVLLAETALESVLCGRLPIAGLVEEPQVFRPEPRPGIEVDNGSGNVVEGRFFTRPYRRFHPPDLDPAADTPAGFYAWFETLAPLPAEARRAERGFLGGDRRRVRIAFEPEEPLQDLREAVAAKAADASGGFYLYLLTPAIAGGGSPTVSWDDGTLECVASAVGKPRRTSGWNTAKRQPRKLVALLPAGSVYFFRWPAGLDGARRAELLRSLWLQPAWPRGAAVGFGRVFTGVWG